MESTRLFSSFLVFSPGIGADASYQEPPDPAEDRGLGDSGTRGFDGTRGAQVYELKPRPIGRKLSE